MKFLFTLILSVITLLNVSAQQKSKNPASPQQTFDRLYEVSRKYFITGKYDSLPGINRRLLLLAQKTKADSSLLIAYRNIGNYFFVKNDYSQALEYDFKSLAISESSAPKFISSCCTIIAIIYIELENYPSALQYLRKAQQDLPLSSKNEGVYIYTNLGRAFAKMNKPDSALKYTQLALEQNVRIKDSFAQPSIFRNLAFVYELLNEPELVNYYYKKSIRYSDSTKNPRLLGQVSKYYSRYLLQHKNYPEAKKYALVSYKTNRQLGSKREIAESSKILYGIYSDFHMQDSAYYYLKVKDTFQDSLLNEQKTNQLQALIVDEQIKENEKDARATDEAIQRRHNIQYAAIAVGLISFVIIFLLFSRSVAVSTRLIEFFGVIGLLVVFEFINLVIHPYLALLTNDSPVLMLLALVITAALIIPLHHKLERWITHKLVEKNKAIRLAAAKRTIEELEGK